MSGARRVLHVTEAFGGGVLVVLSEIARAQSSAGWVVELLYAPRRESPNDDIVKRMFAGVRLRATPARAIGAFSRLWWLFSQTRIALKRERFDAIHLHSSYAGFVGRIARLTVRRPSATVCYSPHGWAFLRLDKPRALRWFVRVVERALARIPGRLILVSESEAEMAVRMLQLLRPPEVLPNTISLEQIPRSRPNGGDRPKVMMLGRVSYQKAPWCFADAARQFQESAEFVWIGGGDDATVSGWLENTPVTVTGWVTATAARDLLASADLVFFPTLWEGMPMALIEAQAMGIPVVASNVVGNRDVVLDGVTGFVCDGQDALVECLRLLLFDAELRRELSENSWRLRDRFSSEDLASRSARAYGLG